MNDLLTKTLREIGKLPDEDRERFMNRIESEAYRTAIIEFAEEYRREMLDEFPGDDDWHREVEMTYTRLRDSGDEHDA